MSAVPLETLLNCVGEFSWAWNYKFFIETQYGNYVWYDPDYNGDNTIRRFNGGLEKFTKEEQVGFVRDKGRHVLKDYIGTDVTAVEPL